MNQKDAKIIVEEGITGSTRESGGQGGLSAIQADLDSGKYSNQEAFEADVKGVLQDFIETYTTGETLHTVARKMVDLFDDFWGDVDIGQAESSTSSWVKPKRDSYAGDGGVRESSSWSTREPDVERKTVTSLPVNPECKACMGKHVAHVSVCTCMHAYTLTCIYTCMHACTHAWKSTMCIRAPIPWQTTQTCRHACRHECIHARIHVYAHMRTCSHAYTCIHSCILFLCV